MEVLSHQRGIDSQLKYKELEDINLASYNNCTRDFKQYKNR